MPVNIRMTHYIFWVRESQPKPLCGHEQAYWGPEGRSKVLHISDVLTAGGFNARDDLSIFIRYQPKKTKKKIQSIQTCFMGPYHPNGGPPFCKLLAGLLELLDSLSVFFSG